MKSKHGFWVNILLLTFLVFVFYGSVIKNPNTTYFSASGDGLKSTFGSIYHLRFDTSYLRTNSMNYPFGESIFYTGSQPVWVNSLKFLKSINIDLSDSILGILNSWMLLSLVLAGLFIYLILRELNLPVWYSIFAANVIVFLSPQLDRFGGHFNLAYVYFLPLFIYLVILFRKKQKVYISFLLGFSALLSLATHAYFFIFYGFLIMGIWLEFILNNGKSFTQIKKAALHIGVQLILPFVLFQIFVNWSGEVTDRTAYPWGFFSYLAYPQGVFFPLNTAFGKIIQFKQVPWEGISYIGLIGLSAFLYIIYQVINKLKNKAGLKSFIITDNGNLNYLFWVSILALLFSMGIPFTLGFQKLLNYMGPLKQIRAAGRFAWLFYYSINIISFYLIWNFVKGKKRVIAGFVLFIVFALSTMDAYLNVRHKKAMINNSIESLNDSNNELNVNNWYKEIVFDDYQAIIPLPYYHIGSENYWVDGSDISKYESMIASIKTGLPLTAVMLGRTSMTQTIMSLQLFMEPYNEFPILDLYPNNKAFLIIYDKNGILTEHEKRVLSKSGFLAQNEKFEVRKIWIKDFREILSDTNEEIKAEVQSKELYLKNSFWISDSSAEYFYDGFGDKYPGEYELGEKCFVGHKITKENNILESELSNVDTAKSYIVSFWIENMDQDLYPRTVLATSIFNEKGDEYSHNKTDVWRNIKIVDSNGWGLVEIEVKFLFSKNLIKMALKNNLLTKGKLKVDEILIRPAHTNIYMNNSEFMYKNNRFYKTEMKD